MNHKAQIEIYGISHSQRAEIFYAKWILDRIANISF